MADKKTLTWNDFCECKPCTERGNEIYPTTSSDQVIINNVGTTLEEWLGVTEDDVTYNSLYEWFQAKYTPFTLEPATTEVLGGVIIDPTYLTITNEGLLSINLNSLNIPSVDVATYSTSGTVKLGNSTALTSNFSDSIISGQVHDEYEYDGHVYAFPLRLDSQGRAGIVVPTSLLNKKDSKGSSGWILDWSKKLTNVNTTTLATGIDTNYILLGNKSTDNGDGYLGYDDAGELSIEYGYPRLALVAGKGIKLTRYSNAFIRPIDNYWGDSITEIMITSVCDDFVGTNGTLPGIEGLVPAPAATDSNKFLCGNGNWEEVPVAEYTAGDGIDIDSSNIINQSFADASEIGGIKLGFTKDGNKKPVQIITTQGADYGRAFVDTEQHPSIGSLITSGLSTHYFRVEGYTTDKYVPIIVSQATNLTKSSVLFEILGRENNGTYYGKYYLNNRDSMTYKLLCLSFYTENAGYFSFDDIVVTKWSESSQRATLVVYKKIRTYDDIFIINILAENLPSYSTQHYFYTSSDETQSLEYKLSGPSDFRVGTYDSSTNMMTAKFVDDASAPDKVLSVLLPTNATFYSPS